MDFLIPTLLAVTVSSAPATSNSNVDRQRRNLALPATAHCAVHLLNSKTGCATEDWLRLSTYQKRRINATRRQTRRAVASLTVQLRRANAALANAQRQAINPLHLRRLAQRRAMLIQRINRLQRRGVARVNAVLTPRQKLRCKRAMTAVPERRWQRREPKVRVERIAGWATPPTRHHRVSVRTMPGLKVARVTKPKRTRRAPAITPRIVAPRHEIFRDHVPAPQPKSKREAAVHVPWYNIH